jgi:hypothetical protein
MLISAFVEVDLEKVSPETRLQNAKDSAIISSTVIAGKSLQWLMNLYVRFVFRQGAAVKNRFPEEFIMVY